MKKIMFILCLMPPISFAAPKDNHAIMTYQQLCAKEQDPIKRQNYCFLFERHEQASQIHHSFRKDIAIA